jgi:hypothetical protein
VKWFMDDGPEGHSAAQVPQPAQAAVLTTGRGLGLGVHGDGVVGADLGALAAGFAVPGDHPEVMGSVADLAPVHEADGPGRGGRRLGHRFLDVLGALRAPGVKDAPGGGIHRLKLGMGFQEEAVGRQSCRPSIS